MGKAEIKHFAGLRTALKLMRDAVPRPVSFLTGKWRKKNAEKLVFPENAVFGREIFLY